jgi:uncharacterized protein (TIGR02391 family)
MPSRLKWFEAIARVAARRTPSAHPVHSAAPEETSEPPLHPFDARNVHPDLPLKVRKLFDDGYFADATFTAFKYLDKRVQKHSGLRDSGYKLMMDAFDDAKPKIQLTPLKSISEVDEQKGYRFVFAGSMWAIRNPRGHEFNLADDPDTCLDHLSFLSMLLRRLERSGYKQDKQ